MANRVVSATEFKAKCLALLDEVESKGGTITVTKRGRAVATVCPVEDKPWKFPYGAWAGKIDVDRLEAIDLSDLWDCVNGK
jgi:prevent-host-death family protein